MRQLANTYVDLDGRDWPLSSLDLNERRLAAELIKASQRFQNASGDPLQRWCDFDNYWTPRIVEFYSERGVKTNQIVRGVLFNIAQDLSSRMAVDLGLARLPDYRDQLEELLHSKFKTHRQFCKATGLSEDMLSHVLAGRKDLSVKALSQALDRIGYTIEFVPRERSKKSKSA